MATPPLSQDNLKDIARMDFITDANKKAFGVAGDTSTPTTIVEPTKPRRVRTSDTTTPAETAYQPQTAEQIQREMTAAAQGQINSLREYEQSQLAEQKTINEKNDRSTASVSTLTGLVGSSEANVAQQATTNVGKQANQAIRAEAELKVQALLGNIRQSAVAEARAQREEARMDEEARLANRAARQEEAVTQLTNLTAGGVTYEGLQAGDPESFNYLASQFGGADALKGAFTLNTPQEQIIDKRLEGGKYIIAKQNPVTGKISVETVDLGLPVGYSKTIDAGNRILAVPDNWDGDPSKLVSISKGLTPGQAIGTGGSGTGSAGGGTYGSDLDAIIGATESIIPSKFGQETFRKNIAMARSEADKISLIASVVLGKADAATKTDFTNQAVGIKQIDKAIQMLDEGAKTGVLQSGAQYAFNLAGKDFDPKLAQINQYLISAIQPYRNSVTGAAWGSQEDGEYQQLFGSTRYSPQELRQRLVGVKEILASKSATALGSYVNPLGTYGDPFNTGSISTGGDIASRVDQAGYDYEAMKADGLSDSEILSAIGQ